MALFGELPITVHPDNVDFADAEQVVHRPVLDLRRQPFRLWRGTANYSGPTPRSRSIIAHTPRGDDTANYRNANWSYLTR